jgi:hypothetical protein
MASDMIHSAHYCQSKTEQIVIFRHKKASPGSEWTTASTEEVCRGGSDGMRPIYTGATHRWTRCSFSCSKPRFARLRVRTAGAGHRRRSHRNVFLQHSRGVSLPGCSAATYVCASLSRRPSLVRQTFSAGAFGGLLLRRQCLSYRNRPARLYAAPVDRA